METQIDKDKLIKHLEQEVKQYINRSDNPTFCAYAAAADHLLMKIKRGYFDLPEATETTESA